MVHRAGARAEVEHCGQRAGEIVLRAADGRVEIKALGKVGRDGARERAAGAVGVGVVDALAVEPLVAAAAVQEVVGVVEPVSALAQDGAAVALADGFSGGDHVVGGGDGQAREHLRLRDIGREHGGKRQQPRLERGDGVLGDEPRAARGDHHGVDDDVLRRVVLQPLGDDLDEAGGRDHADLHRVRPDVGKDAVDLLAEECRSYFKNTLYAGRVLGGQRRDRTHGKYAIHGHGFQIGLNTGASAGIASGDR